MNHNNNRTSSTLKPTDKYDDLRALQLNAKTSKVKSQNQQQQQYTSSSISNALYGFNQDNLIFDMDDVDMDDVDKIKKSSSQKQKK